MEKFDFNVNIENNDVNNEIKTKMFFNRFLHNLNNLSVILNSIAHIYIYLRLTIFLGLKLNSLMKEKIFTDYKYLRKENT